MRVSDAERTDVANTLIRHYADGRLDEEEYNERLAKANTAKTRADLAPLLTDLPPLDTGLPVPSPPPRPRQMSWVIPVAVALAVAWTLSGLLSLFFFHPHLFRPGFPWPIVLVVAFVLFRRHRWHHRYDDRL
jgi:Domain of unknown function (DUF1707)